MVEYLDYNNPNEKFSANTLELGIIYPHFDGICRGCPLSQELVRESFLQLIVMTQLLPVQWFTNE